VITVPWDADSFRKKHNKNLTDKQAARAARIANDVLEKTGDEAKAVRAANARMKFEKG
jgi:hypothetical protein